MDTALAANALIFLLVLKVGLAASLAALLARSKMFRAVLFIEARTPEEKAQLMLFLATPLAIGVILRLLGPYPFADLTLEGAFLLGLLGGRVAGLLGGSMIALPAFLNHEWLAMPVAALGGLLAGLIRQVLPNKEIFWNFGPFTFVGLPRWLWRVLRRGEGHLEMLPLVACVVLDLGRIALGNTLTAPWLFILPTGALWSLPLLVLSTVMAVGVPIKIWNNTRTEMKLAEHQQLLLKAKMDALAAQINPHFLFNTLNTVSSLIRFNPDLARVVVIKLSNILRRLLRKQENFVPLREEITFLDDYLDIEVARFGSEKLRITKRLDEPSLDLFVPAMLLQPIVENAIKHGLSPKLEGGEIIIRTRHADGRLSIEIEDDGIGMSGERLVTPDGAGIGIQNVQERLRVLYGDDFLFDIQSRPGLGTHIHIEVPELIPALSS